VLGNLRCVGGLLAGHDPTMEGSREGVALATTARVALTLSTTDQTDKAGPRR
jgi:anaerobic glycerol-3-phosphate dehydrogenase